MTQTLRPLNSKERKEFHKLLHEQFGFAGEIDGLLFHNDKQEKYFLFSSDLAHFDSRELRVDTMGLYIAAFMKGKLRLTIEGAERIGPHATKNVIALNDEEAQAWIAGANIPIDILEEDVSDILDGTFLIVQHGADWLGTGRKADQFLYNYVPKTRQARAAFDPDAGEKAAQEAAGDQDDDA